MCSGENLLVKLSSIAVGIYLKYFASLRIPLLTGLLLLSGFSCLANPDRQLGDAANLPVKVAQNRLQNNLSVAEIARQVTVRILSERGGGSGVIINRQGQNYTVLTCDHVVDERGSAYTILTPDGRTYPARLQRSGQFGNNDLALVQFSSDRSYQVVAIGNSDALAIGDELYASGFPNWYWLNKNEIENTRSWGLRAFRLTRGNVGMISERSLPRGYQLGYTNEVEDGMSGGPVLDADGALVGINGRLKFPPQGIQVYRFADGTTPSSALFQRMEALSWAIPVTTFDRILGVR